MDVGSSGQSDCEQFAFGDDNYQKTDCTKTSGCGNSTEGGNNNNQRINCNKGFFRCANFAIGHDNEQNLHCNLTTACINNAFGEDQVQKIYCSSVDGNGRINFAFDYFPASDNIQIQIAFS